MIREEKKAVANATPATLFNSIGWDGLPAQIQQAMAVAYGSTDNAKAGLSKSNLPLVNLFAVYAMGIKGDATAATAWLATAPAVWQNCMIQVASAIVDGEGAPLVKLIANGHLSAAAAEGWESQRKAAEVIAAGAIAADAGLSAAVKALDSQIATAKQGATDLFDAWRPQLMTNYMVLASGPGLAFDGSPEDPKFMQPLLKPDPLGRGAYDPALPEPYQSGFKTAKNPTPFKPHVTFLSGGQQLAKKQRILTHINPKTAAAWNDAVRPAIQTVLDLLWLRREAQFQQGWQDGYASTYTKKAAEFAANAKMQGELSAKVKADAAAQLAKLPPFTAAIVASAGLKLGKALAAAKYADDAYAIQKLAILPTDHAHMMSAFAQALELVKVKADGLASDVAAQLQAIGQANIPAAEALTDAGRIQTETATKGTDLVQQNNEPPTTPIDAAAGGTGAARSANSIFRNAGERGFRFAGNGQAITATNEDTTETLKDPKDPPPPVEEPKSNTLLWAIGLGLFAKLLLR
jgi:hypothetical protein